MRRSDSRGIAMVWVIVMVSLALIALVTNLFFLGELRKAQEETARLRARKEQLDEQQRALLHHASALRDRAGCQAEGDADPAQVRPLLDAKKTEYKLVQVDATLQDVTRETSESLLLAEMGLARARHEEKIATSALEAAKGYYTEISAKKSELLAKVTAERDAVTQQVAAQSAMFDGRMTAIQAARDKVESDRQEAQRKHNDRLLRLNNDRIRAKSTVDGFRRKEAVVRDIMEIQGHLMHPDSISGFAYIDLGQHENVRAGLKFRVVRPDVAGTRRVIGEIEVKRIFEHMSEVSITRTLDWRNPIIEGDGISNPFYRRDREVRVSLAGKFTADASRFSREETARRLVMIGAKVEDKATVYTDFVIVGSDAEADKVFEEAAQIGAPIVRAVDIQDYLGD